MTTDNQDTPQEFVDLMAEWMIAHGPDRHCDGHEEIARLACAWAREHSTDNQGEPATGLVAELKAKQQSIKANNESNRGVLFGLQKATEIAAMHEARWQAERATLEKQRADDQLEIERLIDVWESFAATTETICDRWQAREKALCELIDSYTRFPYQVPTHDVADRLTAILSADTAAPAPDAGGETA